MAENQPVKGPPAKRWWAVTIHKKYIPHFFVASIAYFIISLLWLAFHSTEFISAVVGSVVVYVIMTAVGFWLIPVLRAMEEKPQDNRVAKVLFGNSSTDSSDTPSSDKDGKEYIEEDRSAAQDAYRREARIKALKRDAEKMHDRELRMGAIISVGLVLFWVMMNFMFGLSPEELYLVPWPFVALFWFLHIIWLPRWLTYISFFSFAGMSFGLHTMGPSVLMMLPNFIMLPIFYLLMMFFMFGSIMLPTLMKFKFYKPGEGNWEVLPGSMRGQPDARAVVETQMDRHERYSRGESDRKPATGMALSGPPGTGKTMLAMEVATKYEIPFVHANGMDFNAPFMGFGPLITWYFFHRAHTLDEEHGGCIIFVDEGDSVFVSRSGMQPRNLFTREVDIWDVVDIYGNSSCQGFDLPYVRSRQWNEQQIALVQPAPPIGGTHPIFMGMPGGMGGGSGVIDSFMTEMSGVGSPPLMDKIRRRKINELWNALFVPVVLRGRILRYAPGKPKQRNIIFITATNRLFVFDPAILRPGRFSIIVPFDYPDEDGRADVADEYLKIWHKKGYYQDDLITPERIREFAKATPNTSPAEIKQMVEEAVDVRVQHVAELRRLKRYVDSGKIDELSQRDKKYWLRFKDMVYDEHDAEIPGWDDERVDWHALMETKNSISAGRANPNASNETTRRKVSIHELGHLLGVKAFNGSRMKVTIITTMPRRGNLGSVGSIPYDTREQHPQEFYEGLVRTSVASWVAERIFFGQNLPGVSGDLHNATNVAALMVGKQGMSHFTCTPEEQKYYAMIGDALISEPEADMFNPLAIALISSVLKTPSKRKAVATIIGMAAIDVYRLLRHPKNQKIFLEVIPELLKLDEFVGNKIEELWTKLDEELVTLDKMEPEYQQALPDNAFAVLNSFYGQVDAEGAETYKQIVANLEEVAA